MNDANENDCLFYGDPEPLLLESGQTMATM